MKLKLDNDKGFSLVLKNWFGPHILSLYFNVWANKDEKSFWVRLVALVTRANFSV